MERKYNPSLLGMLLSQLMGAGDIAKEYGKSKQYWSRLMVAGEIPAQKTGAGYITSRQIVEQYINTPRKRGRPKSPSN